MTELLTPQGIPSSNFSSKAVELETVLTEKTTIESKIAETEMDLQDLLQGYDLSREVRESSTPDKIEEEKLKIFKPAEKKEIEGLVYTAARAEGRAFSEIVSNPPLMKALEKKFDKKFRDFFREVDDVFHMKQIERTAEVDEEKTTELRTKYRTLVTQLRKQRIELKATERKIENVEKYLDFCKKVVSLAPAPQKGGDKNQQQGGGQK